MKVLIDGADLDDSGRRWFLDFSALLPAVATRDVAKLRLPSRSGVTVRKLSWGEGSIKLSVNVPPQRAFGDLPTLPVEERTQQLQALLARASLVTVVVDGKSLSTSVTDVNISDPSRMGPSAWRVEATLTLQPFWREAATLTSPVMSPGSVVFAQWAGSTGDVQDGVLRVKGPLTKCSSATGPKPELTESPCDGATPSTSRTRSGLALRIARLCTAGPGMRFWSATGMATASIPSLSDEATPST